MQQSPIHIVPLFGRLGNQMFQYAFWLNLKHKYPEHSGYLYPVRGENDLGRLFGVSQDLILDQENVEKFRNDLPLDQVRYINEEQSCQYQEINAGESLFTFYNGYWQTERYFGDIADKVRGVFTFPLELLNEKTKQLAAVIQEQEAVSIHIRRGDYCSQRNKLIYCTCDPVYYAKALALIRVHAPSASCFYIFSDEPEWVKANFQLKNSVVVDWNQGDDYWQDMYLMSVCRHHIIANSTFSWWGAWLNTRPDKIVIGPHRWFNNRFTPDILPADWLHVYPENYQRNKQIELLENGTIRPEGNGLFDGRMGIVLFLYHYSRYSGDLFYERVAGNMLDVILANLSSVDSIGYGNGMAGIGYSIEYLIRNGFVEGDTDDILSELDDYLADHYEDCKGVNLEYGLEGLIRYFRFRLEDKEESSRTIVNRKILNTICDKMKIARSY